MKKRALKKLIAMMLSLVMAFGILAACTPAEEAPPAGSTNHSRGTHPRAGNTRSC